MDSTNALCLFPGLGTSLLAIKKMGISLVGVLGTIETIASIRKNFSCDKCFTEEQKMSVPRHNLLIASPRTEREWEVVECVVFLAHPRSIVIDFYGKHPTWVRKYCYPFVETFSFQDVGLPYNKKYSYLVGTRKDLTTKYTFDFPYFKGSGDACLEGFLDNDGSFLRENFEQKALEYNKKATERGYRFKKKILTPKDALPALTAKYCKDRSEVSIRLEGGIRYFKPIELAKIMGFPKSYVLPDNECLANRLLADASSPEILRQIVEEVLPWMP